MKQLQVILTPGFLDVLVQIPEFNNLPAELDPEKVYELKLEIKEVGEEDEDVSIARSSEDAETNGDAPDDGGVVGDGTRPPKGPK